jgi:hypothetical protein
MNTFILMNNKKQKSSMNMPNNKSLNIIKHSKDGE